jgi:hypothetical protein
MVLFYFVAGRTLLKVVFGPDLQVAHAALPVLGIAMSFLACVYLIVQFMLGMHRSLFLVGVAIVSAAEPALLFAVGRDLNDIALSIAALELALFCGLFALALRRGQWLAQAKAEPAR